MAKTAPAQEPKTGHQILLRNRHRGYKYELWRLFCHLDDPEVIRGIKPA